VVSAIQRITSIFPVAVDIKPDSCPDSSQCKSKGVLPVTILGTEEFDVNDIDAVSISYEYRSFCNFVIIMKMYLLRQ